MRSIVGMATEGAVYQQTQRWLAAGRRAEPSAAIVDSRTLRSTPESGERAVTDDTVELAWIDQGYTGERAANAAARHGIAHEAVKLQEAKRGFVLLPRRRVVERSFAWATRFRRLVKDHERYADTLAGLHVVAFDCIMMKQAAAFAAGS